MASLEGSLLSAARARRRPARYSPELSPSAQQHQHQQQHPDTCIGGLLLSATAERTSFAGSGMELHQAHEMHEEQQQQQEGMASAMKRPKPKRRYRKRQQDEGVKKPRVANVLLENEMIIDEIRERKALWMRTHDQHHSTTQTTPLWEEIAKSLDTTQENIRRRWKSLKDHYRRELKKSMTDTTAPPSTWPYYQKMRFMKSQMFVSLRRKNGEDHLEILSDDDDINGQWHGQEARKQEGGSDTMDDYELSEEYNDMVKYEQQVMQQMTHGQMEGVQEEEEEEEEEEENLQQQQHHHQHQQLSQQEEEEEEQEETGQDELSPIASLQDQEELNVLQQKQSELSDLTTIQQQPVLGSEMSPLTTIAELVGINAIATTSANSLSNRLSKMQQRVSSIQRTGRLTAIESRNINGEIEKMSARHSAIEQQRATVDERLSALQRNAEIQRRVQISAMHERAEISALRQRTEMQHRNGEVGDVPSLVSPIIGDIQGISDDYHFFMSLMPHVRHFTSLQKLKVRNRIQQIIIEECSNCQYDPLENC